MRVLDAFGHGVIDTPGRAQFPETLDHRLGCGVTATEAASRKYAPR
jgi:hypothetical protein